MNTRDDKKLEYSNSVNIEHRNNVERLVIDSHALLKGQRQIVITHAGDEYMLSVTKQGKLILTK